MIHGWLGGGLVQANRPSGAYQPIPFRGKRNSYQHFQVVPVIQVPRTIQGIQVLRGLQYDQVLQGIPWLQVLRVLRLLQQVRGIQLLQADLYNQTKSAHRFSSELLVIYFMHFEID